MKRKYQKYIIFLLSHILTNLQEWKNPCALSLTYFLFNTLKSLAIFARLRESLLFFMLLQSLKVSNDYCGEHGVNTPIDGSLPVTAVAAVTFNVTATAITVVDGQNDTQALVGTADGHLLKVRSPFDGSAPHYA